MTKEEAVAQFDAAVADAKGALYDAGVSSNPPSDDVQGQIDAAVQAQKDSDKASMDDLQAQLDQAKSDDNADKEAIAAKQAQLDQIRSILGL